MRLILTAAFLAVFSFQAQAECIKQTQLVEELSWPAMETISLTEADKKSFRAYLMKKHDTATPSDTFVVFSSSQIPYVRIIGFVTGCAEGWLNLTREQFNSILGRVQ